MKRNSGEEPDYDGTFHRRTVHYLRRRSENGRVLENVFGNVVKYAMEGTRVYAEISNRNKKKSNLFPEKHFQHSL